ncbi:MAG: murein L,D-transpeptidase family protein [Pseudomonadota bacterium]
MARNVRSPHPALTAIAAAVLLAGAIGLFTWRHAAKADPAALLNVQAEADMALFDAKLSRGSPVYIRIFKQESELELWMKRQGAWKLFETFPICTWSGDLGPKLREGDRQSPEGFYSVTKGRLNPNSSYHLAFNLGFPNLYDRKYRRTGSFLMVHGGCASIGCYAMTDPGIEVIYRLVEAALMAGQDRVPVHIFPFRMTDDKLKQNENRRWAGFWQELKPAYDLFEKSGRVPSVTVVGKSYVVSRAK